jgi:hypothetical protein
MPSRSDSGGEPLSQLRLRGVWLLDQQAEGIECLPQLRQGHAGALKQLPGPPHGSSLGVLGLVLADQEGHAERVFERQRREVGELERTVQGRLARGPS